MLKYMSIEGHAVVRMVEALI